MAGLPKTVDFLETLFKTTEPKRIFEKSPIFKFSATKTFAPKKTSLPIFVEFNIEVLDPINEKDPNLTLCAIIVE